MRRFAEYKRRGPVSGGMNVADAMTPRAEVVTVELPGTRDDVLTYLQERGFSSVPVVKQTDDGEEYRGLVSREDLIEQPDEDQLALLLREVPTTAPDATVEAVAELMVDTGTRRVPVVDGGLVGIVTVTDVVHAIASGEADGDTAVGDLAAHDINTTYVGTPLTVAEREIYYANVPYADWMWEGIKAVGNRYIPTRNVEIPTEPVETFMTTDLVTVSRTRTAKDAAQMMISNDIEQIPLVSGDELVGVVRDINLLEAL
jgi:CBS domain-containing protein